MYDCLCFQIQTCFVCLLQVCTWSLQSRTTNCPQASFLLSSAQMWILLWGLWSYGSRHSASITQLLYRSGHKDDSFLLTFYILQTPSAIEVNLSQINSSRTVILIENNESDLNCICLVCGKIQPNERRSSQPGAFWGHSASSKGLLRFRGRIGGSA